MATIEEKYWLVELDGLSFRFTKGGTSIITCALNDPLVDKMATEAEAIKWGETLERRAPWMKGRWKAVEHTTLPPAETPSAPQRVWHHANADRTDALCGEGSVTDGMTLGKYPVNCPKCIAKCAELQSNMGKPQDEPNPMYELCAGCSHKHGHHAYDVHGKASCFQGCGCNRFETSGRYWEPCEPQDEPKRPEPAPSPHAAVDAILTQIARAKARVRELESAINWVCGCGDSGFDPEENLERGAYWWRTPLVKRARMIYNGNKYVAGGQP